MAPTRPRLLFNAFAQVVPSHHMQGLWRTPFGQKNNFNDLDTWVNMAKTIEAAKFDGLFLADHLGLMGPYGGNYATHAAGGICFPNNDAVMVSAALAAVTKELSLGFTSSLIQNQPFELARLTSTLDHLTKGRVAWNIVTSALNNSYQNVGFESVPTHAERYARADEFLDVVYALWEGSWADDAVVRDAENAVYADPEKIFKINHKGPLYSVEGPHLSEPSPQKAPFLYTAGMSTTALKLAAKHAEGLLIAAGTPEHAKRIVTELHGYMIENGRRPGDIKVMQDLKFVVGSTHEEAERKYAELSEWIDPVGRIVGAGGILGLDLGIYGPDEEFDINDASGFKGIFGTANLEPGSTMTTIRKMVGKGSPPIVGTPEEIADKLEEWQDAGIGGVSMADYLFHGSYTDFAEHVTPVLQERGIAQREYAPGTFREKVFAEGPYLNDRHPAAGYRGAYTDALA